MSCWLFARWPRFCRPTFVWTTPGCSSLWTRPLRARAFAPPNCLRPCSKNSGVMANKRAFTTKLLEPAGALLAELDLHDDPGGFFAESVGDATVSGFAFGTEPLPLRPALAAPGCFVHLFARDPSWASAHCDLGLVPCPSPGLDLASLRLEDLASPTVFHQLRALLTSGAVFDLHVSAPVLSFASRGPFASRTPRSPSASHLCRGSLRSHDRLARRLCFLLCLAVSSGVFVSVTQPASSMLFRLHCFRGPRSFAVRLGRLSKSLCSFFTTNRGFCL